MKSSILRSLLLVILLTAYQIGFAQDAAPAVAEAPKEEKTFTFGGSIDTYFRSSLKTTNPYNTSTYAPSTSFADGNGFSIGMVNLIASYQGEKAGFVADVVFGPRGKAAVFGPGTRQAIVNQAFAYYKFNDNFTLNLGQFNTFVGYEVISPTVNFHYSTSYLFSWGPFNHTGLRADFAFGDGFVAKAAIMNPTDVVEFNPVSTYTFGAQLGKTSDAGGVWLNFLYGDQDGKMKEDGDDPYATDVEDNYSAGSLFQADLTLGYNLGEKFYLGFNTSYQTTAAGENIDGLGVITDSDADASSFLGFAVYPKVTLSESFALGLRAEYFSITNNHLAIIGLDDNFDGNVMAFTLSGNYKVGGFTFIPEVRVDKTSENSYFDKDNKATDLMPSLTFAAVYKF